MTRRRRQRERQKSNRLNRQNNNSAAAAHRFLYTSVWSWHDYDVKLPSSTFYGAREQATKKVSFSF